MKIYSPVIISIKDHFELGMYREIPHYYIPKHSNLILDIGPSRLKTILQAERIPSESMFFNAEIDKLPYHQESVDIIHCHHIFEHLLNPFNLLREIDRVLNPKGCVYVTVPHYSQELAYEDPYHVRFFAIDTFDNLFNNQHYGEERNYNLKVYLKYVMAIVDRNLSIFYQLTRRDA